MGRATVINTIGFSVVIFFITSSSLAGVPTQVSIDRGHWQINDMQTYAGSTAEGLLMNTRMVNAVFEDVGRPEFDPDANTEEFVGRIRDYVSHGVLAFTVCLQGGWPGYEGAVNSAFEPSGSLRRSYLERVRKVIEACNRLGAVVILGCYYQRQDQILKDEDAVRTGVVNVAEWVRDSQFGNIVLEIANEFGHSGFDHPVLKTAKGQVELIRLAKKTNPKLLVSTSGLGGGRLPEEVAQASDFLLIHFNTTKLEDYAARIDDLKKYGKPVVCNEDEEYGTDGARAARLCVQHGASWGFMEDRVNQHFPFNFRGSVDDATVYGALKKLTTTTASQARLRVIVETDAGGDPDDEQSLVRFLLYSNEWDVEGIICNRPTARERENRNSERTGLGIVQNLVKAYGACYPNLVRHDARYPPPEQLLQRTVSGYEDSDDGVNLIISAVDADDPRPLWFMNWGTDHGSATSSLKRALDRILEERGASGYARFKDRLRLSSSDKFGEHTTTIKPPFRIWIDTFGPELDHKRWYHRFSALTATAGGFDLKRDVLTGHGPLGALYPTNTTHQQKEGDTMTFLYLVPTGMNNPEQPTWGSWAGRYGRNENYKDKMYYWANQQDTCQGSTSRDNTLKRWAVHLQNDFKARLDWCVTDFSGANHPPVPRLTGPLLRAVAPGDRVRLDAGNSTDVDGDSLNYAWMFYPEIGSYRGTLPQLADPGSPHTSFVAPKVDTVETIHLLVAVTDDGAPPLTRYRRVIVTIDPNAVAGPSAANEDLYFPTPDVQGGWRKLENPDEIRRLGGMDKAKLDEAFKLIQGSTKNGGLLVVRHGWLVYEDYFGLGHHEATANLASCGKTITSIAVGILVHERPDIFPDGLKQKVFTPSYFPSEAFPLTDPRKKDIQLGQILAFSAGIRGNNPGIVFSKRVRLDPAGPDGWYGLVDENALGLKDAESGGKTYSTRTLWCEPGGGYSYATAGIHLASIMLRHVTGMELQEYVDRRLAKPMDWGRWGYGYKYAKEVTHTPGGGGIVLCPTDMLRFGYLLLQEGRWGYRQLVPAEYVRQCGRKSTFNPHCPYSLQFNVNTDGERPGLPRDAFWKSGSGGHALYIVPSHDLVVWKFGGRDSQYRQRDTGMAPHPETAGATAIRKGWKQTVESQTALYKTLETVIDAITDNESATIDKSKSE